MLRWRRWLADSVEFRTTVEPNWSPVFPERKTIWTVYTSDETLKWSPSHFLRCIWRKLPSHLYLCVVWHHQSNISNLVTIQIWDTENRYGAVQTNRLRLLPHDFTCIHKQWVPVSARKLFFSPSLLFHAPVVFIEGSLYCFFTHPKQKCASLTEACLKGQDSCVVPLSNMPTRAIWQGHLDLAATFNFWSWHLPNAFSCST